MVLSNERQEGSVYVYIHIHLIWESRSAWRSYYCLISIVAILHGILVDTEYGLYLQMPHSKSPSFYGRVPEFMPSSVPYIHGLSRCNAIRYVTDTGQPFAGSETPDITGYRSRDKSGNRYYSASKQRLQIHRLPEELHT